MGAGVMGKGAELPLERGVGMEQLLVECFKEIRQAALLNSTVIVHSWLCRCFFVGMPCFHCLIPIAASALQPEVAGDPWPFCEPDFYQSQEEPKTQKLPLKKTQILKLITILHCWDAFCNAQSRRVQMEKHSISQGLWALLSSWFSWTSSPGQLLHSSFWISVNLVSDAEGWG